MASSGRHIKWLAEIGTIVTEQGGTVKWKKNCVMFFGPRGSATAHFTPSDGRVAQNFLADLRRAGIDIPREVRKP